MARPGLCLTRRGFAVGAGAAAVVVVVTATGARAGLSAAGRETFQVAERPGLGYLPPHVIREQGPVERHARAARGREVAPEWARLSGGAVLPYRRAGSGRIDDGFLLSITAGP